MGKFKPIFTSFRMKKWSGGMLIMVLAMVLVIRYISVQTQPEKRSDHQVLMNHTVDDSKLEAKRGHEPAKKPQFTNFEGLDYLFSDKNISREESKALLLWSRMCPFLARSDALLETAQGIKEAALAWKDLAFLIDEEKRVSGLNDTESKENGKCCSSINVFDRDLSGGRPVLELPCGLVEDSSMTVVGIPDEHSRSFQIQLVGAELSGEMNPPILLHYNVSLSGDSVTEEPSIVQNTWTEQLGWGKEERCPGHGSSKNQRVDELPLCNEHTIRSTLEESQNTSHPNRGTTMNVSRGTYNFPFVEGNPFTATLWVGSEGFHMTVNGQHETSFAYRQKLEPWSVSAVRVSGGLNLLSALATGLPVPDDHGLTKDEKLKAPSLSGKRLVLLIGVFSTGNNFKRRMALRRSWMQYKAVRSGKVAVRFLIGLHTNAQVNFEMWREAQAYGDIQFMPFVDYYGLITLKTIALCVLGTKVIPAKYIMKTDDDAFVRIDELLSSLVEKPSNALLYGLVSFDSQPNREEDSKWYISKEQWPHDTYPPWAHGPGYVISRDIAKFVVKGHQKRDLRHFKLEDVAMGIWIQLYNRTGQIVNYINDERFHNVGCESNYILAHYQGPRLVLCLWEKLQKENQAVCCE